jgi:hypothetical protein
MNVIPVAWHPAFMLILVLLIFIAFIREIIEPEMIAIISLVLVVIAGVLTPGDAFALFGNNAVVSIGCMFVIICLSNGFNAPGGKGAGCLSMPCFLAMLAASAPRSSAGSSSEERGFIL